MDTLPTEKKSNLNQSPDNLSYRVQKRLSFHHSERKILLYVVDLILINLVLVSLLYWQGYLELGELDYRVFVWLLVLTLLWTFISPHFGIYNVARAARMFHSVWRTGLAVLATTFIYGMIPLITPPLPNSRFELALFPFFALLALSIWRLFYATVLVQPRFSRNVLVVGAGLSGQALVQAMSYFMSQKANSHHAIGYKIIGFIDDDPVKRGADVEGFRVLGTWEDLVPVAIEQEVEEVVVAITNMHQIKNELYQALFDCRQIGISVNSMSEIFEKLTGRIPVEHTASDLRVVLPLKKSTPQQLYLRLRRIFDVVFAFFGCLFLLVTMPFIWLVNRLTDPGDLFYRQERVGKNGRVFTVIKYRSMIMDAEKETGAVWAVDNDNRITPFGNFLRKTRLDEVPQFWNILSGHMSLIGPRPERPVFVAELSKKLPYYRMRHSVTPGITGWAQVNYPYGSTVEDALVKLEFDLYYIKHTSLYLDLRILMSTVRNVIGLKGR